MRKRLLRLILVIAVVGVVWYAWQNRPIHLDLDMSGPTGEWADYGNDSGGTRYSPLTQITTDNVKHLEIAWEYHTGDVSDGNGEVDTTTAFEATPILVDGILYFPTPFSRVIALDPETGEERWVHDPKIDLSGNYSNQLTSRGMSYWKPEDGEGRILFGTVDEERQVVIANVMDMPWAVALFPIEDLEEWRERYPHDEIGRQLGTPCGMVRKMVMSSLELPCNPPPWGTIAAVDLKSGDILWEKPFGTVRDIAPVPIPIKLGVPNLGGPTITGSGLIFIGAAMDDYLRAFDIETGKELWKGRLPAGGQATPMTYRIGENSKQYVVIAAGGHGRAGTTLGDSLIAFALPE